MKRILILIIAIIISALYINNYANKAYCDSSLRNYKPIQLAKGSFLKAISQRDISTSTAKVGDVEYFINPENIYIGTTNIIPKNSVYLGEVQEVREAVEGVNAAMIIKIYKIITPDKNEFLLDANVYWNGSTTIGGDLSEVAYYDRMPHYPGDWKRGALQLVPTSIRQMGHPTTIRAGEEVTFVINDDLSLYKPLN